MTILLVLVGFVAAVAVSEIILRGAKLQNAPAKAVSVHLLFFILVSWTFLSQGASGFIVLMIFWAGAFLSWFGVRSHLESSILLRMLYLLRERSLSAEELLGEYKMHYGEEQRLQELVRGRFVRETPAGMVLTIKGVWVLRIASLLK